MKIEIAGDRHLETLGNCGGYYSCPKSSDGKRLGPLVGYAGKYEGPGGIQLQWVGDVYANFAKAEVHSSVLKFFAGCLSVPIDYELGLKYIDYFCGTPIGGYSLADALGFSNNIDVIKAEKKVTALATSESREKSKLVFARHDVQSGYSYVLVEDVCNNFSTTEELIGLISSAGGTVLAIACFLNRSLTVDQQYQSTAASRDIPVISLVRLPINEWKQDDPAVTEDVAKGNVVWKPKDEWDRLTQAMRDNV